jgi:glycosyltransferase involved in cell wall biosynthesis
MLKSFLFVSIDGITDPLGQSQILPYLIELTKKGNSVGIASVEKEVNFGKNKEVVQQLCKQNNITWNYTFYDTKVPIYSQYKNYKNLKAIVAGQVKSNNTILHCRSYLPGLIGLDLKKRIGVPFIFDMRGFWADERIEGNIWKLSNPIHKRLYNFFKRKEKELFQNADQIVSLTHKAKEIILSWKLGIKEDKIHVIPCCADLTFFSKSNLNLNNLKELKSSLNISDNTFVLNYNGSLGTWYMIDEMIQFFKELLVVKDSVFLIVTKDDPEIAFVAAKKYGLDVNRIIVRSATRAEMPSYIGISDVSLFFIRPTFSKSASSPTKMGELLSMQVPVITNKGVGDVDDITTKSNCGVLVDDFNSSSYKKAIKELLANIEIYKTNAEATAAKYFDLNSGAETYNKIYLSFKNK